MEKEKTELELKLEEQGLSADDVLALVDKKDQLDKLSLEIAEREAAVAEQQREQEITEIRLALEGKGEHEAVTSYAGRAHYPVVVDAVDKALRKLPMSGTLRLEDDGEVPDLRALVLSVANAIPEEGRFSLEQPNPGPQGADVTPVALDEMTPEQKREYADQLLERLGV